MIHYMFKSKFCLDGRVSRIRGRWYQKWSKEFESNRTIMILWWISNNIFISRVIGQLKKMHFFDRWWFQPNLTGKLYQSA